MLCFEPIAQVVNRVVFDVPVFVGQAGAQQFGQTEEGVLVVLDVATIGNASGVWTRKSFSALTLGILPVFHS